MNRLFKTTVVIWSEFDGSNVELSDLAWEAERGSAICTKQESVCLDSPTEDPDFVNTGEFFMEDEDA